NTGTAASNATDAAAAYHACRRSGTTLRASANTPARYVSVKPSHTARARITVSTLSEQERTSGTRINDARPGRPAPDSVPDWMLSCAGASSANSPQWMFSVRVARYWTTTSDTATAASRNASHRLVAGVGAASSRMQVPLAGPPRRLAPRELTRARLPRRDEPARRRRRRQDVGDRVGSGLRTVGRDEDGRVAADFGDADGVGCDDGYAGCHRLERRQTESFDLREEHEQRGACIR